MFQLLPELKRYCAVIFLLVLISPQISAIDVPDLSQFNGITSGVVGKNISTSPFPLVTSSKPTFTPPVTEEKTLTGEANKISFVLNKVIIDGNHVFTTAELQTFFKPYLHHKITVAKLQELVQAVTNKYQNAGYFLSKAFLPPQEIHNGTIKVTIIEGFISSVKVQDVTNKRLIRFIEKYGANIQASKPIKLADLERTLLLLNDIPGFKVKSVLAPDPNVSLGSTLTLFVTKKPVDINVTQDNYQTRYLGPNETAASASINSLFTQGGTLYGHVLAADQGHKLKYYELKYSQTLGTHGWLLSLDGYVTKTNPQFILAPLELFGTSNNVNTVLYYPVIRSKQRNLNVIGQFEYMNNTSTALGQLLYKDPIRDASLAAQYSDMLWKGEDSLLLTIDKGLNILDSNPPVNRSRVGASNNFLRIIGTASRNQFISDRFSLYTFVTAQYSNAILPAAQTMIFGGPYLGRGYDWAQFTGDNGVAGKVEFRMNTAPNFPFLKQVQYYVFYDVGQLGSLIPRATTVSGAAAGVGARAMIMKYLNADAFLGRPLTTPNATQIILGRNGNAFLGYFQISASI
ncbi:MAG: ShlB/FhaC/HecB family hemolysin secretion/activation protein [Legionellales bacterium]